MGNKQKSPRHVVRYEVEQPPAPQEAHAKAIEAKPADGSFRPPPDKRLRKKYRVPSQTRVRDTDPYWLIIRELTADEMNDASKIASSNNVKASQEISKFALEAICRAPDGNSGWQTISHADGDHDMVWGKLSQKVRSLVAVGTRDINITTDAEDADFLTSGEVL